MKKASKFQFKEVNVTTNNLVKLAGKLNAYEVLTDLERLSKAEKDLELTKAKQETVQEMVDNVHVQGINVEEEIESNLLTKLHLLDDSVKRQGKYIEKLRTEAHEELKQIAIESELNKAITQSGAASRSLITAILQNEGIDFAVHNGDAHVHIKGKTLMQRLAELKEHPETSILFRSRESNRVPETTTKVSNSDRNAIKDYLKHKGNPFSKESFNLTMQGLILKHMPEKANELRMEVSNVF